MGRRKKNDVFVIGDEQLAAETQALRQPEPDLASDRQEPGGPPPPGLGDPPSRGRSRLPRWMAALGIAAVAATALGTLELSSSSDPVRSQGDETSARPALVLRPAPSAAASSPPSPTRRDNQPGRSRPANQSHRQDVTKSEPEREPAQPMAPVSSPTPAVPLPVAEPAPASTPPSPPPPSSGGGPGGVENFGFER